MNIRELSLDWSFLSDEVHLPIPESEEVLHLIIKDQRGEMILEKVLTKRARRFTVNDLPQGKYIFEIWQERTIVKKGTFVK